MPAIDTFQESGVGKQSRIVRGIGQRMAVLCASHWDINAVWQLSKDIHETLGDSDCVISRNDRKALNSIFDILKICLTESALPDEDQNRMLTYLSGEICAVNPTATQVSNVPHAVVPKIVQSSRLETPPSAYWRQWQDRSIPENRNSGKRLDAMQSPEVQPTRTTAMIDAKTHPAVNSYLRIYHLSDYSALSLELDTLLEQQGMDLELLNSIDELSELLQALPADLVLIDAGFKLNGDAIQSIIKDFRLTNPTPIIAVQITDAVSVASALATGIIDAALDHVAGARVIADKVDQLLRFGKADQFRVLIVEDDRSQAMFAEGILRNAEIITKVLLESDHLLSTIDEFKPDLILMDFHMPNASGIELTELIRANQSFQNTPIVFLSGEADEELQADALEAGGDDFLTKPIRPRRLIAAVQSRIKRHRAMHIAQPKPVATIPGTGLVHRSDMLDLLNGNIGRNDKALLFIELNGFGLLKDRLGLTSLEHLLKEFSAYLVLSSGTNPVARFGDGSFVMIYTGDCADNILGTYASKLRAQLMAQKFEIHDQTIELRIHIGICYFEHAHNNTDMLINAAERAARIARSAVSGVSFHKPQPSSELKKEERIIMLLNEADSNDCLSHIYQPIVAVAGSEEKQFQTLLRLSDENGHIVSAAEFIPIAEKNNLIVAIDRWSIAKAVSVISDRMAANDEIKLFVNQSNITMLDAEQLPWLKNLIKAHKIPENNLVIEINHDDALLNQHSINDFCQALIYDGVQFCLSRYNPRNDESNLLESLPINYLKLAHKFTSGIASEKIREQVKELVDRAHRRGLEVIGHSVEDVQTAATLWMSGIDYIQGNLVQSANAHLEFGFDQSVL